MDIGSEDQLYLSIVIARVSPNEGDQPNVFMPNFDNARKLALENECLH